MRRVGRLAVAKVVRTMLETAGVERKYPKKVIKSPFGRMHPAVQPWNPFEGPVFKP